MVHVSAPCTCSVNCIMITFIRTSKDYTKRIRAAKDSQIVRWKQDKTHARTRNINNKRLPLLYDGKLVHIDAITKVPYLLGGQTSLLRHSCNEMISNQISPISRTSICCPHVIVLDRHRKTRIGKLLYIPFGLLGNFSQNQHKGNVFLSARSPSQVLVFAICCLADTF